jgi:cytochrome bd ubiquinol oxidase subunit I
MDALTLHRIHFGFTITYHYLYPQLTMGLALLIFILKTKAVRGNEAANQAVRFWTKVFGISFVMGVITGIPMEFQFGTNWSRFSQFSGGIIGQTLAMEGVFAFFLESSFLYLLLFGENTLGQRGHWLAALALFVGTWLSGFFIVCTNAWMQHPVGYAVQAAGPLKLESLTALLTNPWVVPQYLHTMTGTTITASFVVASIGAFYSLAGVHTAVVRSFMPVAIVVGFVASILAAFPTGDWHAKMVYRHQPVTFAAMEGHFHTEDGAGLVLIGQPDLENMRLDNPLVIPRLLSFLTHARWHARIEGLSAFPKNLWPTNIPILYYSYHIMAGLGTFFIGIMLLSVVYLVCGKLYDQRWLLWILMCSLPFPFIANTAGWMTAEFGRQPWIIYNLMRTAEGYSEHVSTGNAGFTLLGFMGMYAFISILFLFMMFRIIGAGPRLESAAQTQVPSTAEEIV